MRNKNIICLFIASNNTYFIMNSFKFETYNKIYFICFIIVKFFLNLKNYLMVKLSLKLFLNMIFQLIDWTIWDSRKKIITIIIFIV